CRRHRRACLRDDAGRAQRQRGEVAGDRGPAAGTGRERELIRRPPGRSVNLLITLFFLTLRTVRGIPSGKLEEVGERRGEGTPGPLFRFSRADGMRGGQVAE